MTASKRVRKSDAAKTPPPNVPKETAEIPTPGESPAPAESINATAAELTGSLDASTAEPPKRGPGRPKGSGKRGPGRPSKAEMNERQAAESVALRDQRVGLMATALAATFGPIIERAEMQPPFGMDQARALAVAWDPVLEMYMKDGGPWVTAISATVVVMLPYALQMAQRRQEARARKLDPTREVTRVE